MVPVRRTSYRANPNEEGGVIRAMAFVGVIGLMACSSSSKEVKPEPKPGASAETKSAAPESPEAKAAAEQEKKDESKLVCTWEKPTGSNIPEKVCRMPEQIEADRDAAQRTLHSNPPVQTMKGG
jgi:cell division protein FtsN